MAVGTGHDAPVEGDLLALGLEGKRWVQALSEQDDVRVEGGVDDWTHTTWHTRITRSKGSQVNTLVCKPMAFGEKEVENNGIWDILGR